MVSSARTSIGLATLAALALASCGATPAPRSEPTRTEVDTRLEWWRDARFGLFIHWGLYAIPAGEWGSETNHGEWIRDTAKIPIDEYDRFAARFDPVKFDADAWVRLAKDAGMKYVVITSKHHDGFCLFDSRHTDFDVMSTPFRRDVMRELADACARHGLRVCWYHSIMDWHHPDYLPRRGWESRPAEGARFERYVQHLHAQVAELLTNYGPIGVMWFDGEWESSWTNDLGRALYDHCRALQPEVIVNNRVSTGRAGMAGMTKPGDFPGDFGTPEQEIPAQGLPGVDWETCMTMNDHWGFNARDQSWKSRADLLEKLVDIASKGGNFLLNVGPTALGEIPPASVELLRAIGAWLAQNGDSIYGTRASPFASLPWGRCTQKQSGADTTLFLHVFDWPSDGRLVLEGLGNEVRSASLVAEPRTPCRVSRTESAAVIELPSGAPDPDVSVVRLEIAGAPIVFEPPEIRAVSTIFVDRLAVELVPPSPELEVRATMDGTEPSADSPIRGGSIELRETTTVRARSFFRGKPVGSSVERTFQRVVPRAAATVGRLEPGVVRSRFTGKFDRLPNLASMPPITMEVVPRIALPEGPRAQHTVLRFAGMLRVPKDGVYEFALASDDGSRMWIDGELAVDNDGLHGAVEQRGTVALAAGAHALRVEWFNKTGGAELEVRWGPVGGELEPIAADALAH